MPQSLSNVLVHLVFSTKNRTAWLTKELRQELFAYLVTVLKNQGCKPVQVGGVEDHVHVLFAISRTLSMAKVVEELKTGSSKWLKTKGIPHFSWQTGYGVFSVSPSDAASAIEYVKGQEEHHRTVSFMDEFLALMASAEIEVDERYVWD